MTLVDRVVLGATICTWSRLRFWDRPWFLKFGRDGVVYEILESLIDSALASEDRDLAAEVERCCFAAVAHEKMLKHGCAPVRRAYVWVRGGEA